MRKLLSILLLVVLSFPLASPLLALTSGGKARLPACCRRAGKHHCMGADAPGHAANAGPVFSTKQDRCPYATHTLPGTHPDLSTASAQAWQSPLPANLSARVAHAESLFRIARDRSRHKRGPPPDLS